MEPKQMHVFIKFVFLSILIIGFCPVIFSQALYLESFKELKDGLEGRQKIAFKDAVFITENAYFDKNLDKGGFNANIEILKKLTAAAILNYPIQYNHKDSNNIKIYVGVFKLFSDTVAIRINGENFFHEQFEYDFDDIFGSKVWQKTFITKLMETNSGNCHSLPYLYKILCNEFNVQCHLALSPNHIYIKHRSLVGGWYNTERTSASFPTDTWLMASGYISLQAVQNGIYLDTLSEKESIALCVLDLAQGYNHKYPDNDGTFVIECCDLALKHFPDYVNAILLKAETRLKQLQDIQKRYSYAFLKEVTANSDGKAKWDEMNSLYMQLYKLGYRQMPEQMYVEWLTSLKTEKEKYRNKNAPSAVKD